MDKRIMALLGVITLGVGGAASIALQTHAQTAAVQPATTTVASTVQDVKSATDTDNIQNDKGGVDTPDAAVTSDGDVETNDDSKAAVTEAKGTEVHDETTGSEANDAETAD